MSKRSKARRGAEAALGRLYDSLPTLQCQGKCQTSCGPVPLEPFERLRVAEATETDLGMLPAAIVGNHIACPLLQGGRCSVYGVRPLLCRLWGMVDDPLMRCPWGCKPSRYLSNKEVQQLFRKLQELSNRYFEETRS